jgi:hypothetical protein
VMVFCFELQRDGPVEDAVAPSAVVEASTYSKIAGPRCWMRSRRGAEDDRSATGRSTSRYIQIKHGHRGRRLPATTAKDHLGGTDIPCPENAWQLIRPAARTDQEAVASLRRMDAVDAGVHGSGGVFRLPASLLAQGLPPILLIKSSWVRPCRINHAEA